MHHQTKPISLDELESRFLSGGIRKRRSKIVVEEGDVNGEYYKVVEQAISQRYKRRMIAFAVGFLALLLVVPIFLPDRYEVVKNLISIFLAALSGFAVGKIKIFQAE